VRQKRGNTAPPVPQQDHKWAPIATTSKSDPAAATASVINVELMTNIISARALEPERRQANIAAKDRIAGR